MNRGLRGMDNGGDTDWVSGGYRVGVSNREKGGTTV